MTMITPMNTIKMRVVIRMDELILYICVVPYFYVQPEKVVLIIFCH